MAAVLLVDSNTSIRSARETLEAHGHDVLEATSAADGEQRLREGGIDVVVVEYELPGGIEAFVGRLERLPDAPPFVLVAGSADAPAVSARLGATAFLVKPCNPDELCGVLARIVPPATPSRIDDGPTEPVRRI
jgi:DNA-binding NtrC family response regulator